MSQGDTLETVKMSGAWVWMLNYFIRVYPPRYAPHPWFCLDLFEAEAQRKPKLGDYGLKDSGANPLTHSPFR